MRNLHLIITLFYLISCSDSATFRAVTSSGAADDRSSTATDRDAAADAAAESAASAGEAEVNEDVVLNSEGIVADLTSTEDRRRCAGLFGINEQDVLDVTDKAEKALTQNSVLIVTVTGNAKVTLGNPDIAAIKGLCLITQGTSVVEIHTRFSMTGMFIDSGGNSSVDIFFESGATLGDSISLDFNGTPSFHVHGAALDCPHLSGLIKEPKFQCTAS